MEITTSALRLFAALILAGWGALSHAQVNWFTVIGDPTDPAADTVLVDPTPVAMDGQRRTMNIKVSRARTRVSPRNVTYRSYIGQVMFDCGEKSAFFLRADLYDAPIWQGPVSKSYVYPPNDAPRMAFREIEPNPAQRIIRAACSF